MRKLFLLMLLSSGTMAWAQTDVTGRVTSKDGSPLANVSVTVKNGQSGTSTDIDGKFKINAAVNAVLLFSSVGYLDEEVAVGSLPMQVSLTVAQRDLREVVVTGYSTQTRRQTPASIAKVQGDVVKLQPVGTFDQMLTGTAPGVLVQSQSGQPGASASNITIRGKGSVLASTQPLFIVDGIQVTGGDFQSINPADIESYSVLKDAVATSQYGSRGANGVIVVTTKRGSNGKTKINYDFQYGVGRLPENRLVLMNSKEKIMFETTYDHPYGMNFFGWLDEEIDSLSKVNADWESVLFRKAITKQHILSLTGGNDKTRFFISGSAFDQQGLVINTALKRYTGRINIDHTMNNLKIGLTTFVGSSKLSNTTENSAYIGDPLNAIRWANPYVTPYLPDGSYNMTDFDLQGQPNALQEINGTKNLTNQLKAVAVASVEYKFSFLKGLSAKTSWGTDYTDDASSTYTDKDTYTGSQQAGTLGSFQRGSLKRTRFTGTTSLSYTRQIDEHNFRLSLFNEYVKRKTTTFNYTGYGLTGVFGNGADVTPGTPTNNFIPVVADGQTEQALLSYFALGDYSFNNKYFFNASFRRDGSSRLAKNKRWVNYAGVGAAWQMNAEDFLSTVKWLSDLRLRVSYGAAGNEDVGDSYEAKEQFSGTIYSGVPGLVHTNLVKPDLTWEVRKTFNAGVDFGLFKNRISGTVELYNAITKGLYLNRQLSGTNGVSAILSNLGRLQNRGIEISLSADVFHGKRFVWNIAFNHTYNKSKVVELDGDDEQIDGASINRIGAIANSAYLVRYAGVDPDDGEALYYTADGKDKVKQYDPNDRVLLGTFDPPQFGAFTSTFSFKGVSLSVQFNYMRGHVIYNGDRTNVENPAYAVSNLSRDLLNEWQEPGQITDIPSPFSNFETSTTRFLEKGNFLRFRNLMLSYDLPKAVLEKVKISSLRFFVQGQNLKNWSSFKGYDPEVATGVFNGSQYPQLQTTTIGLSIGL